MIVKGFDFPPRQRKIVGGATNHPFAAFQTGLDLDTLQRHARGRLEALAEVTAGVALLTGESCVGHMHPVTITGAFYQDARGTKQNPRAHRFPCNAKLDIWNIPEIMGPAYRKLNEKLVRPFAITDLLPVEVNYADSLFESGARDAVREVLEFVLAEQRRGKPPHLNLIRHAISHIAMPRFENACEAALEKVQNAIKTGSRPITFSDPDWLERSNAESMAAEPRPGYPKDNLECVEDVLLLYLKNSTTLPVNFDPLELGRYTRSLKGAFEEGKDLEKAHE